MNAITTDRVSKSFGSFKSLDNVSFSVSPGEVFGLLGPNGAGKSTLMNIIAFLSRPDSGAVTVFGKVDRGVIGLAPQEDSFYDDLTVFENHVFFGRLYGVRDDVLRKRADEIIELLGLSDKRDALAKNLSGGMKRRLNMGCALVHKPKLLILDEPSAGLDPLSRRVLWRTIRRVHEWGVTILLTTHYMDEADELCGRIAVLDKGRVIAVDTPAGLKRSVTSNLTLVLARPPSSASLKKLESLRGVSVRVDGKRVVIETLEPDVVLKKALSLFKGGVDYVDVGRPSLEEFFLKLGEGS
ncbi:MAG: ABC transporter ATP-binding protein [Candidatus Diapherotrites archaeon]|nr:ABC transporter ATP-binding protein [Candidatus Diapherotrites archaeon]